MTRSSGRAVALAMRGYKGFAEPGEVRPYFRSEMMSWPGLARPSGRDRHGLAAENQFRAALAETLPAAQDLVRSAAGASCRPTLPSGGWQKRLPIILPLMVSTLHVAAENGDEEAGRIWSTHGRFRPSDAEYLRKFSDVLRVGSRTQFTFFSGMTAG